MSKRLASLVLALVPAWTVLAETKTTAFEVKGWTCSSCATSTRIALKKLEGVEDVKTDLVKAEVVVTYDDAKVTPEKMAQAIERVGYKAKVRTVASSATASAVSEEQATKRASVRAEPVSFFEVPLECGAAEGLGCGSAAKRALRGLERNPKVKEARINYPGTVLAIVWKDATEAPSGVAAAETSLKEWELEAALLQGSDRDKTLKEYETGRWYRAADVDRLSEREAEVIASRLVNRAKPHLGLSPERLASLTKALSAGIAEVLTRDRGEECAVDPYEELTAVASKHLNPQQLADLRKAAEQGVAALPGEPK